MVKVNGDSYDADGKTAAELLDELGYSHQKVALELNEEIIPRAHYADTLLKDGDTLEVVHFVGGG